MKQGAAVVIVLAAISLPVPSVCAEPSPDVATSAFPDGWTVTGADDRADAWLYPPRDGLPWSPIAVAQRARDVCGVVDATAYAERLDLADVDALAEWELDGFEPAAFRGDDRLVNALTRIEPEATAGGRVTVAEGELVHVDASDDGPGQRTYVHHDQGRWTVLTCRSSDPPPGRWESLARSFFSDPIDDVIGALPTPRPTTRPTPSLHLTFLRQLVPLRACDSRPAETERGALAVLACTAADDVDVVYALFSGADDLTTWYRRQVGTVETVGEEAFERCEAGEAVESDWVLDDDDSVTGRFVCRAGTPASQPSLTWTYEPSLLGGRATSDHSDLPTLYGHWFYGEYDPDLPEDPHPSPS